MGETRGGEEKPSHAQRESEGRENDIKGREDLDDKSHHIKCITMVME